MLHGPFAVSAHRTVTLFFPFSLKGTTGFEAQIDKCLELAEYLYNKIKNREGYEMVFDGKVCTITAFFPIGHLNLLYIPGHCQQVKPTAHDGTQCPCIKTCCCADAFLDDPGTRHNLPVYTVSPH